MKYLLPLVLFVVLACSGVPDTPTADGPTPDAAAATPAMPFSLPPSTTATSVNQTENAGVSTTMVSFETTAMDQVDLQAELHEALQSEGWTVVSVITGGDTYGTLTCSKDSESIVVTVKKGEAGGSKFDVLWIE